MAAAAKPRDRHPPDPRAKDTEVRLMKSITIPRRPGPRATIQPTDVPVYYDNGKHFFTLTGAQLEAIVRQGLELLPAADRAGLEGVGRLIVGDLVDLVAAIKGNPDAMAALGVGADDFGRDVVAPLIEWAKSYRAPRPSADPKEDPALEASEVEALWFTIRQCRSIDHGSIRHRACDRAAAALRRLSGTREPGTASPATGSRRSSFGAMVDLAVAVKGNPDLMAVVGVTADDYGLDVAEAVARWARSYRPPDVETLAERDTLEARVSGLESEVKTLRADLEGVGRRAAEAVEGVAARVAALEGLDGRPSTV